MAYLSLYRKYRSQSFEEVAGQDHVTRTLQNAIKSDRVAHAYLFCGPRGTGKTSTARLLAKALNCENLKNGEPCNECSACVQITEGRFLDMREIDAASHRGIEEIRDLRDSVAYTAAQGKYKVYVIDEAHQITGDAFNAFLKTLEEPPPHVVFIMATTESHKIPATIVSRCQKFDFHRASLEQLRDRVRYVAAAEGAELQESALDLIAREANGGWRDALSLLEQVLAFCEGGVTAKDVYTVLGTVEAETLHALAHAAFSRDGAELWRLLDELIWGGKDPRQLLRDVTQHYRNLMMIASGAPAPSGDPDLAERITEQAGLYGAQRLLQAIEVLAHTEREARWSEQPRLLLEVALVRLMHPREETGRPAAAQPSTPAPLRSTAAPQQRPSQPASAQLSSRTAPRAAVEPSPFVEEPPPMAEPPAATPAFEELPPPPLTVGDARAGGGDDDEDFLSHFDELAAAPARSAPQVTPAVENRPEPVVTPAAQSRPEPARPAVEEPATAPAPGGDRSEQVNLIRNKWRLIGEELKRERKVMIQTALVDTLPDRFEVDTLVIAFPNQTMAEMFTNRKFAEPVSQVIHRITGVECKVRAAVGAKPGSKPAAGAQPARRPSDAGNGPGQQQMATPDSLRPPAVTGGGAGGTELVHNVVEVFDGRIMDERDG